MNGANYEYITSKCKISINYNDIRFLSEFVVNSQIRLFLIPYRTRMFNDTSAVFYNRPSAVQRG